jgi:hypothetical protein
MMAPQTIIDYIAVHELCHVHHLDHTHVFRDEVDKVMPNYGERKEWLRVNGAGWTFRRSAWLSRKGAALPSLSAGGVASPESAVPKC